MLLLYYIDNIVETSRVNGVESNKTDDRTIEFIVYFIVQYNF